MKRSFFASALTAGLVAGTLDITAACIHAYVRNGTTPLQVLKGVASGAFDPKTFTNETLLATCGLIIHFMIAISFTFFFFFLAKQIPSLVKYPVPIAILYGISLHHFRCYFCTSACFYVYHYIIKPAIAAQLAGFFVGNVKCHAAPNFVELNNAGSHQKFIT